MANQVKGVQPSVLKWARESQGLTVEDLAKQLKREPEEIEAWERGDSAPTYAQLEDLAYRILKRPLAIFFFPGHPSEKPLGHEFRTLPEFELRNLMPDTRYQLRLARSLQLSLYELLEGKNPAPRLIFREVTLTPGSDVAEAAAVIREYLGVGLDTQAAWRTVDVALKAWRQVVEDAGVFIFKHSFKQKDISAFCLPDPEFPLIYINNGNSKSRQIFSLFHELAHVLLGVSAISMTKDPAPDDLPPTERAIERFCNALAAEFLVPSTDFEGRLPAKVKPTDEMVAALAARYSVSREVVLRKLLDRKRITAAEYREKSAASATQQEPGGSGGDYYRTQATYLGEKYLKLVFGRYYQGRIGLDEVAEFLGVKTKSVAGLEEIAMRSGAA